MPAIVMRNTGVLYHTMNGVRHAAQGVLRLQSVSAGAGGTSFLAWEMVPSRFDEYCQWLRDRLEGVNDLAPSDAYDLSFEAHYRLVTIHPWSDSNGRMPRLVMASPKS